MLSTDLLSRQLRMAKEGVSSGGLGLLAKHKKRERLKVLLEVLKKFKTLVRISNMVFLLITI